MRKMSLPAFDGSASTWSTNSIQKSRPFSRLTSTFFISHKMLHWGQFPVSRRHLKFLALADESYVLTRVAASFLPMTHWRTLRRHRASRWLTRSEHSSRVVVNEEFAEWGREWEEDRKRPGLETSIPGLRTTSRHPVPSRGRNSASYLMMSGGVPKDM